MKIVFREKDITLTVQVKVVIHELPKGAIISVNGIADAACLDLTFDKDDDLSDDFRNAVSDAIAEIAEIRDVIRLSGRFIGNSDSNLSSHLL